MCVVKITVLLLRLLSSDLPPVDISGTGARNRKEGGINAVTLGDTSIAVSKTVKSLGVTLDETLSFNSHVDNVCKAAHFHIRALRHIRRCIDDETARTVASSMVGARLDYCNSERPLETLVGFRG